MRYSPLSPEEVSKKAHKLFEKYPISKAAVFGSCSRNEMIRGSDIDILVEFDHLDNPLQFAELKRKLENLLKRKVDLISFASVENSNLKAQILNDAKVIYEKSHD